MTTAERLATLFKYSQQREGCVSLTLDVVPRCDVPFLQLIYCRGKHWSVDQLREIVEKWDEVGAAMLKLDGTKAASKYMLGVIKWQQEFMK